MAEKDVILDGHLILKDTIIQANYTALHMNPDDFDEPFLFKPERFLIDGEFKVYFFVRKTLIIQKLRDTTVTQASSFNLLRYVSF